MKVRQNTSRYVDREKAIQPISSASLYSHLFIIKTPVTY